MSDEIPIRTPPLTSEEETIAAQLGDTDFEAIDVVILANCSAHWLKVARVVLHTTEAIQDRYPGLSYAFYAERLCHLVNEGRLDSQGDLCYMRFSEVRLPEQSSHVD